MTIKAFTDGSGGYYEADVSNGDPDPIWSNSMTPATVASQEPAALLLAAQLVRISLMRIAYDAAIAAGFTTNAILMQTDEGRIQRLKGGHELAILESESTMDVIARDNSVTTGVTVDNVLIMIRALGVNARTLREQFGARRASINAAANVAAVNAIDW